MKSFEFVGRNIEKAIENGLKELNKSREEVDIKIITEGGLFSKAKVQISFEDENNANETQIEEAKVEETEQEEKEETQNLEQECAHEECVDGCVCENCEEECNCEDCNCDECKCEDCNCEECECEEECDCEDCKPLEEKNEKEYLNSEEVIDKIQEIFKNIFEKLKIDARVMVFEGDDAYEVKVSGDEKVAALIGYRGEGLNAYQTLFNAFLELRNKSKKILIDVENYRNKREESLKALAQRIAKKVVKTKRRHKFEPMSAYERHVIHEELANFNGVTTHSEGVEPHRCLIVEFDNN